MSSTCLTHAHAHARVNNKTKTSVDNASDLFVDRTTLRGELGCLWWYGPVIPALARLKRDYEFEAMPGFCSKIVSKIKPPFGIVAGEMAPC